MSDTLSAAISIGFHGIAFAMVLYLISVGLSVTMGLMGFVNLAHGVFAMLGGYVMTSLMSRLGVPFAVALAGAAVATALASVVVERLLYRPLYGGDELDQVLLTMDLIFKSVAGATYYWGPLQQPMHPPRRLSGQIDLGFHSFPGYRSFLILCGAALVTVLWLGLERTRFGVQIRAAVDNLRMAQSVGINTSRLFTLTFALGSGLAGLGGALGADLLAIKRQVRDLAGTLSARLLCQGHGDGRIDDPNAGWKSRGVWTTWGTRTPFHAEGGKANRPKVVHLQLRPDPLAD